MSRWKKEELDYLLDNFQIKSNIEIANYLRCDSNRVAKKINRLGLSRDYKYLQPDLPNESWKTFPEDPNYIVSDLGRIRNINNNRILKPWYSGSDYYYVELSGKTYLAHRVVALTWIPNEDSDKTEVNHKKGIKNDLRVSQLEWVTPSENVKHAVAEELVTRYSGECNSMSKLDITQVHHIRSCDTSARSLGKLYGVDKSTILNVRNNKTYKDSIYYP